MQIPRLRNVSILKNSLVIPTLSTKSATAAGATFTQSTALFHSTPTSCEKWKKKWNDDERGTQQPSKNYVRYATRQKRADAKRALKDLLFRSGSSKTSFQGEDPIWKFDGRNESNSDSDPKSQSKSSGRRFGKTDRKRMKRKFRRGGFTDEFDDPETVFQERFGNRWYTWSFVSREEPAFRSSSSSGFEWREQFVRANRRRKEWETASETESENEFFSVGSCSDRTILGLPPRGPLKMQDVKDAFRLAALKWHPDKHQGHSQAMAEEKFKMCANAYKSLCDALS